jgi:aspartyl protease family protein
MTRRPIFLWLIAAVGVAALVFLLNARFPWVLANNDNTYRLVYLLCWLALAGGGTLYWILHRPGRAIRDLLIWSGLFLTLIVGYSYRDVLEDVRRRVSGELMPSIGEANSDGSLTFTAASNGHFYIEAKVEGTPVLFMVDTGASLVVLSPADARRIGFDLDSLTFSTLTETANGLGRGAPVTLRNIEFQGFRLTDVPAAVNGADMSQSLLGMSVLSRIGFDAHDGKLTLHP